MYFSFCLLILAIANIVAISSTNLYSMAVPGKDISVSIGVFKSDFSHIIKNVDSCLVTNIDIVNCYKQLQLYKSCYYLLLLYY